MKLQLKTLLLGVILSSFSVCIAQTRPTSNESQNPELTGYLKQMLAGGLHYEERFLEGLGGLLRLRVQHKQLLEELLTVCTKPPQREQVRDGVVLLHQLKGLFLIPEQEVVIAWRRR